MAKFFAYKFHIPVENVLHIYSEVACDINTNHKNHQSAQNRYKTLVAIWESFTTSDDCNNFNKKCRITKIWEKSDCVTLLPPISTKQHICSSTRLSTVPPQAGGRGFKPSVGTIHSFSFSFSYSFPCFLSCLLVPCTHTCTYTNATTTTTNTNWYMHMHMHTLPLTPIQPTHSACKFIACFHTHIQTH